MSQLERILEKALLVSGLAGLITVQLLTFREQTKLLRSLLNQSQAENRRLTSLILAKDPMTYQALEATSLAGYSTSEYVSQGTDEAEARHWAKLVNAPVDDENEVLVDDLEAMGLR